MNPPGARWQTKQNRFCRSTNESLLKQQQQQLQITTTTTTKTTTTNNHERVKWDQGEVGQNEIITI